MTVVVAVVKSKSLSSQVVKIQMGGGMLGFHPHFDIRHNWDGRGWTRRWHRCIASQGEYFEGDHGGIQQ